MNEVETYLAHRKALALFCAENNLIWHSQDLRYVTATEITDDPTLISKWHELRERLCTLRDVLSKEDQEKCLDVHYLCEMNGHFRLKEDAARGGPRFTCIQCLCVFDQDPHDLETLNIPGARGALQERIR